MSISGIRPDVHSDGPGMLSPPAANARGDRAVNASLLLSTVGAGVAGIGIGVFADGRLENAGVPILVIGLAAHVVGMVARRRIQSAQLYRPVLWEQIAYWGCWAAIVGVFLFVASGAAG